MAAFELRDGERLIRTDPVIRFQQGVSRLWRPSRMTLTDQRIRLEPPGLPLWFTLYAWPALALRFPLGPPARDTVEIELSDVDRLWQWRDEFSSPPAIQAGGTLWDFWLVEDAFPWQRRASLDAVRKHYDAVVAAWAAVRAGAAQAQP